MLIEIINLSLNKNLEYFITIEKLRTITT